MKSEQAQITIQYDLVIFGHWVCKISLLVSSHFTLLIWDLYFSVWYRNSTDLSLYLTDLTLYLTDLTLYRTDLKLYFTDLELRHFLTNESKNWICRDLNPGPTDL